MAAVLVLLSLPATAGADMVRLQNGRIITDVDLVVFRDEQVILTFRSGTVMGLPEAVVDEILPDEVPYARAVAMEGYSHITSPPPGAEVVYGLVDQVATRLGLERRLAHAIVRVESNYNPYAVSSKGAMGLMQLMPATAARYGASVAELYDAERNLEVGMRHFLELLSRLDLRLALAAYNAGEGAVARYGGIPPYRETQDYVRKIMTLYVGG